MPLSMHQRSATAFDRKLFGILLAALALRLAWALAVPVEPLADSVIYARTAENLALHGVFGIEPDQPFSYWPVGTSAIYALGHLAFGAGPLGAIVLNLIAGLLLVATSALLARRWYGDSVALLTAAILAAWPSLVMYTTILASEIFFGVFVNLALLAWRHDARRWAMRALVAGLMIAAASYVRPVALLLPAVLAGIDLLQSRRLGRTVAVVTVAFAAVAVAIAPWAYRNTRLHGGFVMISTNGGPNLWMGNNPRSDGGYMPLPEEAMQFSEYERARRLGEEARRYMLDDPARTAALFVRKLVDTHLRETIAVHWNAEGLKRRLGAESAPGTQRLAPLKGVSQAYWLAVLLLAFGGVATVLLRSRSADSWRHVARELAAPPVVLWAYFAVLHAVIVSQDRYHFPSIPFIAMLAALALHLAAARDRHAAPLQRT